MVGYELFDGLDKILWISIKGGLITDYFTGCKADSESLPKRTGSFYVLFNGLETTLLYISLFSVAI